MSHNNNTAAQMLLFPIQQRETDPTTSDYELILQTRLVMIKALNDATAGRRILSEEDKNVIRWTSEAFVRNGYPPLYLNF